MFNTQFVHMSMVYHHSRLASLTTMIHWLLLSHGTLTITKDFWSSNDVILYYTLKLPEKMLHVTLKICHHIKCQYSALGGTIAFACFILSPSRYYEGNSKSEGNLHVKSQ